MSEDEAWHEWRVMNRAWEIEKMKAADRPKADVEWDYDPSHYYLAVDGVSHQRFYEAYGDLEIFDVNLRKLHSKLSYGSRRGNRGSFYEDYIGKTCKLLAHLESGGKVTPPLVVASCDQLVIAGGHHRFGWAKYRKQVTIPILVQFCQKEDILGRLNTP